MTTPRAKTHRFRVRGGSMTYLLRDGDWVRVRPAPPEDMRWGDIVVLLEASGGKDGECRVHRLWGKRRDGGRWRLLTRGDWTSDWDPPHGVPVGVVTEIERDGRRARWEGLRARALGAAFLALALAARGGRAAFGRLSRAALLPLLAWSARGFGAPRRWVRRALLPWPPRLEACRDASGRAAEALAARLWSLA